jgi:hypothetical protein
MSSEQMWEQQGSRQWESPSGGREDPDDTGF